MDKKLKLENSILSSLSDFATNFLSKVIATSALDSSIVSKYCSECQNNYKKDADAPIQLYCHDCTNCHATHVAFD